MKIFKKQLFANLNVGEVVLLVLGAAIAGFWSFGRVKFTGSEWDVLLYLNTAQFPQAFGAVLNRYAHIYLQKLFLWLTPEALNAAKALWTFEIFATAAFVYLCAKLLNVKNTALTGLFALLFFFAQRKLYATAGAPLIEFTMMLFLSIGIFLYLVYLRSDEKPNWVLFALGLVQFLLLKSKETGIIFAPVLLMAIYLSASDWRRRARAAIWIGLGFLVGLALFVVLDAIFLGDPLFGFRLANWRELFRFNLTLVYDERSSQSWYDLMFATALAMPLLFAFLTLSEDQKEEYRLSERLLWALPLLQVIFLSFTMFRAAFPMNFRYVYPAFATIAIIGAQFLQFRQKREAQLAPYVILGSALLAAGLYLWLYPYAAGLAYRWTEANFFTNVIASLLVSLILLILLVPKSISKYRNLLLVPPTVILLLTPILNIGPELAATVARADNSIAPFVIYEDQIEHPNGARLFFTAAPYDEFGTLGRDSGSAEKLFEAYFNQEVLSTVYSEKVQDILIEQYDYAFVTRQELEEARLADDLVDMGYVIYDDPASDVVLIAKQD